MTELPLAAAPARIRPAPGKGVTSVAHVPEAWYVACLSRDLGRKQVIARTVLGLPVVLFRTQGGAVGAFLDRCPHRNVPLSLGEVVGDSLRCVYHGWRFDPSGECREVPCLVGEPGGPARRADAFPVREQDGWIWVYATPGAEPETEPYALPTRGDRRYTTVLDVVEAEGSLHAVAENALDVPHTAFLHKGLFRGVSEPNDISVVVRDWGDRVEAEYIGEPAPKGLAGRILAPGSDGTVQHYDRFFLPCLAQVEYKLGDTSHFVVTSAMTPLEDHKTRLFAAISFRLPLPGLLVRLVLTPIARRIFAQDAVILAQQSKNLRAFGGEQFASTDVDALGQQIRRLLKSAERGAVERHDEPREKRFQMRV